MSRKDYAILADALLESKPNIPQTSERGDAAHIAWNICVENVTFALAKANENFDPERFRRATGYYE